MSLSISALFTQPGLASLGLRVCALCAPSPCDIDGRVQWSGALVGGLYATSNHGIDLLIDQDGEVTRMPAPEVAAYRWCCRHLSRAQRDVCRAGQTCHFKWTTVVVYALWFSETELLSPADEAFLLGTNGLCSRARDAATRVRTPVDAERMVRVAATRVGTPDNAHSQLRTQYDALGSFKAEYDALGDTQEAVDGAVAAAEDHSSPRALSLLWRASRDGFAANEFHRRCDGQGATIVVVRRDGATLCERNFAERELDGIVPPLSPRSRESLRVRKYTPSHSLVGGYSDCDWTPNTLASGTFWKRSTKAWTFEMRRNSGGKVSRSVATLDPYFKEFALWCSPNWGPSFGTSWIGAAHCSGGQGGDVWVCDGADSLPARSTRVLEGAYVVRSKKGERAVTWGYSSKGSEMRVLDVEVFRVHWS